MTALVWFKRDLRLADHAPLHAAAAWCRAQGSKILLAYFIEPDLWAQPDASFRHWRFIADSLSDLRESLHGIGGRRIAQLPAQQVRSGERLIREQHFFFTG